jgi:hypothetical protein
MIKKYIIVNPKTKVFICDDIDKSINNVDIQDADAFYTPNEAMHWLNRHRDKSKGYCVCEVTISFKKIDKFED